MEKLDIKTHTLPSVICPISAVTYKTHRCKHCELGFKTITDLRKHSFIQGSIDHICSECGEVFESIKGMKQHFGKLHSKVRPSRCAVCSKRFRNKYALKIHVKQVHEESSRVVCSNCNIVFFNIYSMKRHLQHCHEKIN